MAKEPKVKDYIAAQLELCGKPQKQVAKEAGLKSANILSMIKAGTTKLPIPRVNALAESLGVSRARLMRLVLEEDYPDILEAIENSLGEVIPDD